MDSSTILNVLLIAKTKAFISGIQAAERKVVGFVGQVNQLGASLSRMGAMMSLAFSVPAMVFLGKAIDDFVAFDEKMRNVNTIAKQTEVQLAATSKEVLRLSMEFGRVPTDLAEALYHINSASFFAADGLYLLDQTARASVAGIAGTKETAKALVGILNAYGRPARDAKDVSDVLFRTVERGDTTFRELARFMGITVSTAAAAGIEFHEVGAAIATLTKGGINASEAFTSLNRLLLRLIKGTQQINPLFAQTEYRTAATMLKMKGLAHTIEFLAKSNTNWLQTLTDGRQELTRFLIQTRGVRSLSDLVDKEGLAVGQQALDQFSEHLRQNENLAQKFVDWQFYVRDLKAALSLSRQEGAVFRTEMEKQEERVDSTTRAVKEQTKAVGFQIKRLRTMISVFRIEMVNTKADWLINIVIVVQMAVLWFTNLTNTTKAWILGFLVLAAVSAPLVLMLGGLLIFIKALIPAFIMFVKTSLLLVFGFVKLVAILALVYTSFRLVTYIIIQMMALGVTSAELTEAAMGRMYKAIVDFANKAVHEIGLFFRYFQLGLQLTLVDFEYSFYIIQKYAENLFIWLINNWKKVTDNWVELVKHFALEWAAMLMLMGNEALAWGRKIGLRFWAGLMYYVDLQKHGKEMADRLFEETIKAGTSSIEDFANKLTDAVLGIPSVHLDIVFDPLDIERGTEALFKEWDRKKKELIERGVVMPEWIARSVEAIKSHVAKAREAIAGLNLDVDSMGSASIERTAFLQRGTTEAYRAGRESEWEKQTKLLSSVSQSTQQGSQHLQSILTFLENLETVEE